MNHEGRQVASYLNSLGMAAFVLRSRLGPRYHHPIELGDAQRAIRTLRAHAAEWRLDPGAHRHHGILGGRTSGDDREHESTRAMRARPTPWTAPAAVLISPSWVIR